MGVFIFSSPDGEGMTRLREERVKLDDQKYIDSISLEANKRFQESSTPLCEDELICTVHFGVGDAHLYKIVEVKEETVVIMMRDLIHHEVPKSSLYDPQVCHDIFYERANQ